MVQYNIKGETGFKNVHLNINHVTPESISVKSFVEKVTGIIGSDTVDGDGFGYSIDYDSIFMVVGVPALEKAYVFQKTNSTSWDQVAILSGGSSAQQNEGFGTSVSVSYERIVVGAPYRNSNEGGVYVFARDNTNTWVFDREIIIRPHDYVDEPSGQFGKIVYLNNITLIVGAPNAYGSPGTDINGAVYIYETHIGSRFYNYKTKFTSNPICPSSGFGSSIGLDAENFLAVGAPNEPVNYGSPTPNAGAVYLYYKNYSTGVWSFATKIIHNVPIENNYFGRSVSLKGSRLLIGAPGEPNGGAVYYFSGNGDSWSLQKTLNVNTVDGVIIDPNASTSDEFGYCVDQQVNDDIIFVGSPGYDNNTGAIFMFEFPGDDWKGSVTPKLIPSDNVSNGRYGQLFIEGDRTLIGVYGNSSKKINVMEMLEA